MRINLKIEDAGADADDFNDKEYVQNNLKTFVSTSTPKPRFSSSSSFDDGH